MTTHSFDTATPTIPRDEHWPCGCSLVVIDYHVEAVVCTEHEIV